MPGSTGALHEAVRLELIRRINDGEYAVGNALPSMSALAVEFGVSAITVKRALRDLQPAGVLRTVPGLGTFVREKRRFIRDLDFSLTSFDDVIRQGLEPTIQLQSITRERVNDPTFEALDAPKTLMMCVRKVVSTDATPIMFDTTYLPQTLPDDVVDAFRERFIGDVLRERGTRFANTRLLIDAAPASEKAREAFNIPVGYPTLRRFYRLNTGDPSFSVYGMAESPFDRLAVSVELNGKRSKPRTQGDAP